MVPVFVVDTWSDIELCRQKKTTSVVTVGTMPCISDRSSQASSLSLHEVVLSQLHSLHRARVCDKTGPVNPHCFSSQFSILFHSFKFIVWKNSRTQHSTCESPKWTPELVVNSQVISPVNVKKKFRSINVNFPVHNLHRTRKQVCAQICPQMF